MSFYQTSNNSIVRFNVRDPSRRVVAPFASMARVCEIESLGAGTGYAASFNTGVAYNDSFFLSPEMLQNGNFIISPTGNSGAGGYYLLPNPFALQEFLGGRGVFNMLANLTTSANTGSNDYFILNVYNTVQATGYFVGYAGSGVKPIVAATTSGESKLTPVLLQFTNVNSPYATIPGTASNNGVSYTVL